MTGARKTTSGDAMDGAMDDAARCPCGTGDVHGRCCGPLLSGSPAPTAERLMRSRYTAFALHDAAYLLRTWHPSTRPDEVRFEEGLRWRGLSIVDRVAGGPFDRDGVVEFEARWEQGIDRGSMRERSRFVREDREWLYVDGDVG